MRKLRRRDQLRPKQVPAPSRFFPRVALWRVRATGQPLLAVVVGDGPLSRAPVATIIVLKLGAGPGHGVTSRYARSEGFRVRLYDGRTVHIPPGRLVCLTPRHRAHAVRLDDTEIESFLTRVDPERHGPTEPPDNLFPYVEGYRWTIDPGDRVKVFADLEGSERALDLERNAPYRGAAAEERIYVPRGVPAVVKIRRQYAPGLSREDRGSDDS